MQNTHVHINTISALHEFYRYGKPNHPLITVIELAELPEDRFQENAIYSTSFYGIFCKRIKGLMKYGKGNYDFDEGTMMFSAPDQVFGPNSGIEVIAGWGLFIHPDLLYATPLGQKIDEYTFFQYDVNEALHISDEEDRIIFELIQKIKREISLNTDKHTNTLIVDLVQLVLNYCTRFYDRQFFTRKKVNNNLVQRFESILKASFSQQNGIPSVTGLAAQLHVSPNYLSDLLSKYTGKSTQEHIHNAIINKAKNLLLGTDKAISEIGYDLGFEHPSHFTKLFKNKTGQSPKEFRSLN